MHRSRCLPTVVIVILALTIGCVLVYLSIYHSGPSKQEGSGAITTPTVEVHTQEEISLDDLKLEHNEDTLDLSHQIRDTNNYSKLLYCILVK